MQTMKNAQNPLVHVKEKKILKNGCQMVDVDLIPPKSFPQMSNGLFLLIMFCKLRNYVIYLLP
jgi:hypothetical protein